LLAATLVAFAFIHLLPGDPVYALAGESATESEISSLRERFGLDRPLPEQYALYLRSLAQGDLGRSIVNRQPVAQEILRRLPATLQLALGAILVATLLGTLAGTIAAYRPGTLLDFGLTLASLLGVCVPSFWLALLLILVLSVQLGWLAPVGYTGPASLIMPTLTLAAAPLGVIARLMRGSMLEALADDYVRTARAKGLSERQVAFQHALRNALLPTLTMLTLQFGVLLSGAIITETVFSWPGIGRLTVDALLARDYPVVQGVILLFATIFVLLNLLTDVVYGVVDPRIGAHG
jgi:peptide/nickel transport system permease protein